MSNDFRDRFDEPGSSAVTLSEPGIQAHNRTILTWYNAAGSSLFACVIRACVWSSPVRVHAIDPTVRNTGYAVSEGDPRTPKVLTFDVTSIPGRLPQSAACSAIRSHRVNVIQTFAPDEVAAEGIIDVRSHQGQAPRAAAGLTACPTGGAAHAGIMNASNLPSLSRSSWRCTMASMRPCSSMNSAV